MSNTIRQQPLSFVAPIVIDDQDPALHYETLRALISSDKVNGNGLNAVATVHFANFIFLEKTTAANGKEYYKKLALFTFYDGDFETYVKDFVENVGALFDSLLVHLENGKSLIPVRENEDDFVKYIKNYDQPVARWYSAYPDKIVNKITSHPVQGVMYYDTDRPTK